MTVRIPKYRFHKASGQALVEIRGRHIYLGKYDSTESHEEYRRVIARYLSDKPVVEEEPQEKRLHVQELVLAYFRYAKTYYLKNGKPTDEVTALRIILRRLRKLYGTLPAEDFGPKAFKTVRDALIAKGLSRTYVNDSMARIKRMFKWAVAEELISPSVYQALASVPGLRRGRSAAKETSPILPVQKAVVDATLPYLPSIVADMVRVQLLTGMRPAEVCILRPCDIDQRRDVWIYQPATHKTEHKGRERNVHLGPQAQKILKNYLSRNSDDYCFRPYDSEKNRRDQKHRVRKTPIGQGNSPGTNRVMSPKRSAGEKYSTASYRRAIHRACDKAFPHPTLASIKVKQLTDAQLRTLEDWRSEHRWSPNQLRHTAATLIRQRYGLEEAQVVLGHSEAKVTEVYAERDMKLAKKVARELG